MKNEEIFKEVDRRFSDQKELIDAKFTHLSAIIQTGFDMASNERTTIIEHQRETNGRVTKLEGSTKLAFWIQKNKKLIIILAIAFIFIVDFATDHVNIIEIIKLLK